MPEKLATRSEPLDTRFRKNHFVVRLSSEIVVESNRKGDGEKQESREGEREH